MLAWEAISRFDNSKLYMMKNVYSRLKNCTENISFLHERLIQVSDLFTSQDGCCPYTKIRGNVTTFRSTSDSHTRDQFHESSRWNERRACARFNLRIYWMHAVCREIDSNTRRLKYQRQLLLTLPFSILENYTTLKTAYSWGEKLLNYITSWIPHVVITTPQSSLSALWITTISARFKKFFNWLIEALTLCRRVADNAFHTCIVTEPSLRICVDKFIDKCKPW